MWSYVMDTLQTVQVSSGGVCEVPLFGDGFSGIVVVNQGYSS